MKKEIPEPSPEEILGHHIKYEIDQMVGALSLLGKIKGADASQQIIVNNAFRESFYVHARALIEFFEKDRGARKYALPSYKPLAGIEPERLKWLKRRLNNEISHLLDGRTADDSLKMADDERMELVLLLRNEVACFKAARLPLFQNIDIPDIPLMVRADGPQGPTNAIGIITSGPTGPSGPSR